MGNKDNDLKEKLWKKVIEKYTANWLLPECLDGLDDDFRSLQKSKFDSKLIKKLCKKYPDFMALSEKMLNELKESLKRHRKHDKRKAEMDEEREQNTLQVQEPDVFLDENGVPYAEINIKGHFETWPIRSRAFTNYCVLQEYAMTGKPPTDNQSKNFVSLNSARAMALGIRKCVFLRAAHAKDIIFLDLCRDDWKVLKITSKNIKLIDKSPVVFKRYPPMKELKVDLKANPADIERVFRHLNMQDEQEKLLYKVSLILNFVPDIPRVISLLYGCQGSAKSTSMKFERAICDPSSIPLLALNNDLRELTLQCDHNYLCFFDNVTRVPKTVSDFLCRIVTGEGQSRRELFTDSEEIVFKMKRKIAINGINLPLTEPDALDRSLQFRFSRISKDQRRTESDVWSAFTQDQPKITGAILKI